MPPKAPVAPIAAPVAPAPVVIPPHVIAASKVVDKWTERVDDVARRVKENDDQIANLTQQRATREQRLKDMLAEVSVIALPKPPEPEVVPVGKGAKPAPKKGEAPPPPPPPPPDEEELKRLQKLQNVIIAIYKKKREKIVVRDTPPPPPTAASAANSDTSKRGGTAAAEESTGEAAVVVAAPPPAPEEPGIVKPADLDPEIWAQVLKLRDERIDTEEALVTLKTNLDLATARHQSLITLDNVVQYSLDASKFELERAKETKAPAVVPPGAGTLQPQRPPSNPSKQPAQRPPSQLLRR